MKKLIPLIGLFFALPCFGQTVSNTTPTPAPVTTGTNGGSFSGGGNDNGAGLEKLEQMTPEERRAFLRDHPELRERFRHEHEEMLDKLQTMTPAQRQEFLKNHLQIQKFITEHPELAERIAKGEAGRPGGNERREGEEMLDKLQSMTPEQRQEFLKNHPQVQKFIADHPEIAKRIANGDPGHPRVNEVNDRDQDEQKRINEGLKNGTLTPEEAAKLQKRLDQVKQQEAADEAKNNGHLTPEEKRRFNREEDRESRRIAQDKHNDQGADAGGGGNNGQDHDGDGGRDGGGGGRGGRGR